MKKIYLFTFLFIYSIAFSFNLSPTFFEQRIDTSGGYQEYIMQNNGTKTQRFKVSVLPGDGEYIGDMSKWTEITPKIITIKPKGSSILKVFVKAPKGTKEGEYSAFLNFRSVPVPELPGETKENTVTSSTRMALNVNIEIIGYVGELAPKLELSNIKLDESKEGKAIVSFKIKNNTPNRGVWYDIDILKNNDDYESLEQGKLPSGKSDEVKLIISNMKKRDVAGIRLRESSTKKEILKKEF